MPEEDTTTPDLVELTRRAIECGARGEVDDAMSFYGPDPVWDLSPTGLGTYQGLAAIHGLNEDWLGAYAELEVQIGDILDLGHSVTLAIAHMTGRPAGSSAQVQLEYASVIEWTDGSMARVTQYTDIDEARAAAERLAQERAGG
jgi:hypothetical protein